MCGALATHEVTRRITVLSPSCSQGVLTYQTIVVYEVSLSLLRLTKKHGTDLGPGEWEEIVNILAVIDKHVRVS